MYWNWWLRDIPKHPMTLTKSHNEAVPNYMVGLPPASSVPHLPAALYSLLRLACKFRILRRIFSHEFDALLLLEFLSSTQDCPIFAQRVIASVAFGCTVDGITTGCMGMPETG